MRYLGFAFLVALGLANMATASPRLVPYDLAVASYSPTVGATITSDVYTSSDTWTKSTDAPGGTATSLVRIVAFGAGGAGGGGLAGAASSDRGGGSGGGGGARVERWVLLGDLGTTETVTVAVTNTGAAAGADGNPGGTSSFGAFVSAFGGGGGKAGNASNRAGGTGGGSGKVGQTSTSATIEGGGPTWSTNVGGVSAGGGSGTASSMAATAFQNAEWGGAAGGSVQPATGTANPGGQSLFGGAGGGAGGSIITANTITQPAVGGTVRSWTIGGGGGASAGVSDQDGTPAPTQGTDATASTVGEAGGGGGGGGSCGVNSVNAARGGHGAAPGGGGGGGGATVSGGTSVAGAGGNGARGEVRVYTAIATAWLHFFEANPKEFEVAYNALPMHLQLAWAHLLPHDSELGDVRDFAPRERVLFVDRKRKAA